MLLHSGTPTGLHALSPSPGRQATRGLAVADRAAAEDRWPSRETTT